MAEFCVEFEAIDNTFETEFEGFTPVSDGGYDRGYAEGYENGKGDGLTEGYAKGETEGYGKGYEQGNTDGYTTGKTEGQEIGFADALAKRTELVVTDSGEYVPEGESTGFKKVTVGIQKGEDLDAVIAEQAELIEELSATLDEKIGAYDVGYDAAIEKLTDLVATENGDYTPPEGSTGFKSVSVNVQAEGGNKLAQVIDGTVTEVTASDLQGATKIRESAFYGCSKLTSVTVPNGVTEIQKQAFYKCAFETISLPSTLVTISQQAFQFNVALKSITIPRGVTSVGNDCFSNCSYLEEAVFLCENLTKLQSYTFQSCARLKTVTLPASLTNIYSAFKGCNNLKTVICKATTPPTLAANAFSTSTKLEKIAVPVGSGDAYKSATNWSAYADKIVEEAM